jgi:hypothetical protein
MVALENTNWFRIISLLLYIIRSLWIGIPKKNYLVSKVKRANLTKNSKKIVNVVTFTQFFSLIPNMHVTQYHRKSYIAFLLDKRLKVVCKRKRNAIVKT